MLMSNSLFLLWFIAVLAFAEFAQQADAALSLAFAASPIEAANIVRSHDAKTDHLKERQARQVTRNPSPAPGAKHSTRRVEEPGRHRNYGTASTKAKRHLKEAQKQKGTGRAWSFGKVHWW